MYVSGTVRKLPGNEKSRIKHQRDREPNSLRQILEEQATQNNRNQGTAKQTPHNHQTDTAPALSRTFPTVLKEGNCAGIECHSLTAPLLRDKAFQPCKDFIVELLSRKGRPHPPVQTDKILLTVSAHPCSYNPKILPALTAKRLNPKAQTPVSQKLSNPADLRLFSRQHEKESKSKTNGLTTCLLS